MKIATTLAYMLALSTLTIACGDLGTQTEEGPSTNPNDTIDPNNAKWPRTAWPNGTVTCPTEVHSQGTYDIEMTGSFVVHSAQNPADWQMAWSYTDNIIGSFNLPKEAIPGITSDTYEWEAFNQATPRNLRYSLDATTLVLTLTVLDSADAHWSGVFAFDCTVTVD